jgi:hypothetical protein
MDAFTYIKNFFNESNRGVWGKQEILLALDGLHHKYMNETTKSLQEKIRQDMQLQQKEVKP